MCLCVVCVDVLYMSKCMDENRLEGIPRPISEVASVKGPMARGR